MAGYIKLHRCILESAVFDNANLLRVWIWCLMKASHKEYTQLVGLQKIDLKPGQFVTGRTSGAEELCLNPSTFWKHLKVLETVCDITLNCNNKFTVVSIENWALYQVDERKSNSKVTAKEQQNNTNKNGKNIYIYLGDFWDRIWSLYPRKLGKGKVGDAQKKKLHGIGEEELTRAIERYKQEVAGKEERFVMHGSTFFNSGYVDYLDENYQDKTDKQPSAEEIARRRRELGLP